MAKYIVGLSATTIAAIAAIAALSVGAICLTAFVCSYSPITRSGGPRILHGRDIVQPLDHPLGSMEAIKEAQLNQEFGPVDKSKLHERKEGIFSRIRDRRAARAQCATSYMAPRVPACAAPVYSLPVSHLCSVPQYAPLPPARESMPQIDPSSYFNGHVALQTKPTSDWLTPINYDLPPPRCPNCR